MPAARRGVGAPRARRARPLRGRRPRSCRARRGSRCCDSSCSRPRRPPRGQILRAPARASLPAAARGGKATCCEESPPSAAGGSRRACSSTRPNRSASRSSSSTTHSTIRSLDLPIGSCSASTSNGRWSGATVAVETSPSCSSISTTSRSSTIRSATRPAIVCSPRSAVVSVRRSGLPMSRPVRAAMSSRSCSTGCRRRPTRRRAE